MFSIAFASPESLHFWHGLSRLGEAQILLPAALLAMAGLVLPARLGAGHGTPGPGGSASGGRLLAASWLLLLGLAIFVTTASKVAFMGWGVGWPALDFTGVSGHAMFAAAVYPLLAAALAARASRKVRRVVIVAGVALALLVAASRLVIGVHSLSEVLAGLLLGAVVSAGPLLWARLPARAASPIVPLVIALWLVVMPVQAPASLTHSWVARLSLALSGRSAPYTRADWSLRGSQSPFSLTVDGPGCMAGAVRVTSI